MVYPQWLQHFNLPHTSFFFLQLHSAVKGHGISIDLTVNPLHRLLANTKSSGAVSGMYNIRMKASYMALPLVTLWRTDSTSSQSLNWEVICHQETQIIRWYTRNWSTGLTSLPNENCSRPSLFFLYRWHRWHIYSRGLGLPEVKGSALELNTQSRCLLPAGLTAAKRMMVRCRKPPHSLPITERRSSYREIAQLSCASFKAAKHQKHYLPGNPNPCWWKKSDTSLKVHELPVVMLLLHFCFCWYKSCLNMNKYM